MQYKGATKLILGTGELSTNSWICTINLEVTPHFDVRTNVNSKYCIKPRRQELIFGESIYISAHAAGDARITQMGM